METEQIEPKKETKKEKDIKLPYKDLEVDEDDLDIDLDDM